MIIMGDKESKKEKGTIDEILETLKNCDDIYDKNNNALRQAWVVIKERQDELAGNYRLYEAKQNAIDPQLEGIQKRAEAVVHMEGKYEEGLKMNKVQEAELQVQRRVLLELNEEQKKEQIFAAKRKEELDALANRYSEKDNFYRQKDAEYAEKDKNTQDTVSSITEQAKNLGEKERLYSAAEQMMNDAKAEKARLAEEQEKLTVRERIYSGAEQMKKEAEAERLRLEQTEESLDRQSEEVDKTVDEVNNARKELEGKKSAFIEYSRRASKDMPPQTISFYETQPNEVESHIKSMGFSVEEIKMNAKPDEEAKKVDCKYNKGQVSVNFSSNNPAVLYELEMFENKDKERRAAKQKKHEEAEALKNAASAAAAEASAKEAEEVIPEFEPMPEKALTVKKSTYDKYADRLKKYSPQPTEDGKMTITGPEGEITALAKEIGIRLKQKTQR